VFEGEYNGGDIDIEEYPPDPKTQEAKNALLTMFKETSPKVYYQRQLEVWEEKKFFHWVTDRALRELENEEKISVDYFPIRIGEYKDRLKIMTLKGNRYHKRQGKEVAKLVEEYSSPDITQDVGLICQELFKVAYARYGYKLLYEDAREFYGKRWERSKKNLDFIVEKNGAHFGCEVENKLGYMDKHELDEKFEICRYLPQFS